MSKKINQILLLDKSFTYNLIEGTIIKIYSLINLTQIKTKDIHLMNHFELYLR